MAVIGAGPAGLATALRARGGGLSVTLIERGQFAGQRVGEHLKPEAVRFLNLALGLDPEDFAAYMLASDAYEKLGRRGLALAAAEEARRINADDPELADRLSRLGKDPE